jgi:hypothetical protein
MYGSSKKLWVDLLPAECLAMTEKAIRGLSTEGDKLLSVQKGDRND